MKITGGCYCGEIRFEADGEPFVMGLCYCRECQYIAGGNPNLVLGMPKTGFKYTKGAPSHYTRSDLKAPVTREFCGNCGTAIATRAPGMSDAVMLKVGTLDDPTLFKPAVAAYTSEMQPYHHIPEGVQAFARFPGQE